MEHNIVDKIGSRVNVWTADGNAMEQRELLTLDTFGIVVTGCASPEKAVFVPWCQVKYVDYPAKENTHDTD